MMLTYVGLKRAEALKRKKMSWNWNNFKFTKPRPTRLQIAPNFKLYYYLLVLFLWRLESFLSSNSSRSSNGCYIGYDMFMLNLGSIQHFESFLSILQVGHYYLLLIYLIKILYHSYQVSLVLFLVLKIQLHQLEHHLEHYLLKLKMLKTFPYSLHLLLYHHHLLHHLKFVLQVILIVVHFLPLSYSLILQHYQHQGHHYLTIV
mmetsp:Transcript_26206/g.34086  ORF Transcript_26206/g.34086 Transcript_26206/m.34086 type:complete len:203 (-) Transcript_26206:2081-2689(-)